MAALVAHTDAAVMAVVKADGYGHGMVPSARAALAGGATWLGVAQLGEALAIRAAGIDAPTLAWLWAPDEVDLLVEALDANISVGVSSRWALDLVTAWGERADRVASVHLKIDTGLSRNGAYVDDWPALTAAAAEAESRGHVRVEGVWSHFASADDLQDPSVDAQIRAFEAAVDVARQAGLTPTLRHLANSAATLTRPDAHYDLVRVGIAIYGLNPVPGHAPVALTPAMTLRSHVALGKQVRAGEGVSYGHRYTTTADTSLALVPLGYGDGIPRGATNVGPVLGRRAPCDGQRAGLHGPVRRRSPRPRRSRPERTSILFGPGTDGEPTAQDWADAVGTIHYEIVTRIGARVPRRYVGLAALDDGRVSPSKVTYGVVGALAAAAATGATAGGVLLRRQHRRGPDRTAAPAAPNSTPTAPGRSRVRTAWPCTSRRSGRTDAPLTVVFVHGYALSLRAFYYQRAALVERFGDRIRLVFYDQRSHGRSGPSVPGGATIEQLGRDLFTVLDAVVPTGPIVLVGHSMGGMSVLSLAQQYPELFASVEAPRRRRHRAQEPPRVTGVALLATSSGQMAQVSLGLPALITRLRGPLAPLVLTRGQAAGVPGRARPADRARRRVDDHPPVQLRRRRRQPAGRRLHQRDHRRHADRHDRRLLSDPDELRPARRAAGACGTPTWSSSPARST